MKFFVVFWMSFYFWPLQLLGKSQSNIHRLNDNSGPATRPMSSLGTRRKNLILKKKEKTKILPRPVISGACRDAFKSPLWIGLFSLLKGQSKIPVSYPYLNISKYPLVFFLPNKTKGRYHCLVYVKRGKILSTTQTRLRVIHRDKNSFQYLTPKILRHSTPPYFNWLRSLKIFKANIYNIDLNLPQILSAYSFHEKVLFFYSYIIGTEFQYRFNPIFSSKLKPNKKYLWPRWDMYQALQLEVDGVNNAFLACYSGSQVCRYTNREFYNLRSAYFYSILFAKLNRIVRRVKRFPVSSDAKQLMIKRWNHIRSQVLNYLTGFLRARSLRLQRLNYLNAGHKGIKCQRLISSLELGEGVAKFQELIGLEKLNFIPLNSFFLNTNYFKRLTYEQDYYSKMGMFQLAILRNVVGEKVFVDIWKRLLRSNSSKKFFVFELKKIVSKLQKRKNLNLPSKPKPRK